MSRSMTGSGRRAVLTVALVAVLALAGSACRPVQPPGVAPRDPTGVLESVQGGRGTVTVTGWATQWDLFVGPNAVPRDQGPVLIAVLVDGEWAQGLFPADRGATELCVSALNQNLDVLGEIGDHVLLGCDTVTVR